MILRGGWKVDDNAGRGENLRKTKEIEYSKHLNLINSQEEADKHIFEYVEAHKDVSCLNIGAGLSYNKGKHPAWVEKLEIYDILELDKKLIGKAVKYGDICCCPQIPSNSYDMVISFSVFEHLDKPWLAAAECIRITKPGGINVHKAPFSTRYHPVPIDCFRYTHTGFRILFEGLQEIFSGYDILQRRNNHKGGKVKGGLDKVPVDKMGGWLENWDVIYVGEKL